MLPSSPLRNAAIALVGAVATCAFAPSAHADEGTPPPAAVPPRAAGPAPAPPPSGEFSFGSYGRVVAASDLRGGTGRQANIVGHGTRIDESTYAEIQLERMDRYASTYGEGLTTRVVSTLAIAGPLFHETGQFEAKLAVRNLFAEASGVFFKGFTAWVGSRMYRGDDIYLLDWWPLDNLNTVGGGVRFAFDTTSPGSTTLALHGGLGRPADPFSFQTRPSPSPTGFGATDVIVLDRPRFITSAKLTHVHFMSGPRHAAGEERASVGGPGVKVSLYGEAHRISEGTRVGEQSISERLPADSGSVVGAQVGVFTGRRDTFVNLFVRYASGIAAYGDKTLPTALAPDKTAGGAREWLGALSANYEAGPFGVVVGAYARSVKDASGNPYSRTTFNEGTFVVRPQVWLWEHVGLAVEGSWQSLATAAVDDAGTQQRASLWRFGVMPFLTPAGRGTFTRPHLRVIYAYTTRDAGARALYAPDDRFSRRTDEHFFGVGAEWWFNSSYR